MTTPARDPRTDPRPGDVLHKWGHAREIVIRRGRHALRVHDFIGVRPVKLRTFLKWARNAEVIHRAED